MQEFPINCCHFRSFGRCGLAGNEESSRALENSDLAFFGASLLQLSRSSFSSVAAQRNPSRIWSAAARRDLALITEFVVGRRGGQSAAPALQSSAAFLNENPKPIAVPGGTTYAPCR